MTETGRPVGGSLDELYRRPGFLLRRAHQISVALFLEAAADLGLTTSQHDVMLVLCTRENLDQAGIAALVGSDRSTTALIVIKLQEAGYIEACTDPFDKRRKIVTLSKAGHAMLDRAAAPAQRARDRALAPFPARDAAVFLALLERFVDAFNDRTRSPIRTMAGRKPPNGR